MNYDEVTKEFLLFQATMKKAGKDAFGFEIPHVPSRNGTLQCHQCTFFVKEEELWGVHVRRCNDCIAESLELWTSDYLAILTNTERFMLLQDFECGKIKLNHKKRAKKSLESRSVKSKN